MVYRIIVEGIVDFPPKAKDTLDFLLSKGQSQEKTNLAIRILKASAKDIGVTMECIGTGNESQTSTPATLTEKLKEINPDDIELYREVFREWLRTVPLYGPSPVIETTRKLLITLVDEP